MTKQEYEAALKYAMDTDRPPWQDIAIHQAKNNYIASLEAEIAQLKRDKLEFKAQCFHKDETISVLKNRITELESDNRSLVEQMNAMAMKPNQEVIDWHSYIEKKPEKTGYYIIYYTILNRVAFDFWHNDKQEWDKYGEYILAWAYLPKGVNHD